MNNQDIDSKEYFKKQMSSGISYLNFICGYYSDIDDGSFKSNQTLLSALYELQNGVCENPLLIKDLIYPADADMGKFKQFRPFQKDLNPSQKTAVRMILAMDNLMVLQGPPGTGKTSVIVEVVKQLKLRDKSVRILITSQSHLAVNNALENFLQDPTLAAQVARIRQKPGGNPFVSDDESGFSAAEEETPEEKLKKTSESAVFNRLVNSSDEKLKTIFKSFDNADDERFGNDFLKYNVSMVLTDKSIVGVTSNSIPGCRFENGEPFDYVIVDEAGKLSFWELINVAKIAKKLVLIGDPNQLPPVIPNSDQTNNTNFTKMDNFDREGYAFLQENNFIEYLFGYVSKKCKAMLDRQYRMSDDIGTYISETYYNSAVQNGRSNPVKDAINFIDYTKYNGKVCNQQFQRCRDDEKCPYENRYEISIIEKLLSDKKMLGGVPRENIAIITPYKKQADLIKKSIKEGKAFKGITEDRVSTVDAYQGKEYDYIIFSCTRLEGSSYFIDDKRRINVAVSRSKKKIFVIGCESYLSYKTVNIKSLINFRLCKKWLYDGNAIISY